MSAPLFTTYYFEDLAVGMRETLMKTVMNSDVVGFANLSGDHNPIHLSDHFARKTRFGGRIAHGLYTASLISAILGTRLPGPGAVYLHQTLNFKGPVKIGDVVLISVEVGLISPPVGMNLFIIQSMAKHISTGEIFRGVVPFIVSDATRTAILVAFPSITLYLLRLMY